MRNGDVLLSGFGGERALFGVGAVNGDVVEGVTVCRCLLHSVPNEIEDGSIERDWRSAIGFGTRVRLKRKYRIFDRHTISDHIQSVKYNERERGNWSECECAMDRR